MPKGACKVVIYLMRSLKAASTDEKAIKRLSCMESDPSILGLKVMTHAQKTMLQSALRHTEHFRYAGIVAEECASKRNAY